MCQTDVWSSSFDFFFVDRSLEVNVSKVNVNKVNVNKDNVNKVNVKVNVNTVNDKLNDIYSGYSYPVVSFVVAMNKADVVDLVVDLV